MPKNIPKHRWCVVEKVKVETTGTTSKRAREYKETEERDEKVRFYVVEIVGVEGQPGSLLPDAAGARAGVTLI